MNSSPGKKSKPATFREAPRLRELSAVAEKYGSPIEAIARHEAAHAVIGHLVGVPGDYVQLWPEATHHVQVDAAYRAFRAGADGSLALAISALAGPAADVLSLQRDGLHTAPWSNIQDHVRAAQYTAEWLGFKPCKRDNEQSKAVVQAVEQVKAVVMCVALHVCEAYWPLICAVAKRLTARLHMTSSEVAARVTLPEPLPVQNLRRAVGHMSLLQKYLSSNPQCCGGLLAPSAEAEELMHAWDTMARFAQAAGGVK